MVARIKSGDYYTPWSAPISFAVKAPFDLSYVGFPDSDGPSYKLRGTLRDPFARGSRVTVYYAKGKKGGRFRKLGRSSKINSKRALHPALQDPQARRLPPAVPLQGLLTGARRQGHRVDPDPPLDPLRLSPGRGARTPGARSRGRNPRPRAARAALGGDARRPRAELPEQALRAPVHAPLVQPQRVGDLARRRAIHQHREQREVVDRPRDGRPRRAPRRRAGEARCRRGPRRGRPRRARQARPACRRGRHAPATRARSPSDGSGSAV